MSHIRNFCIIAHIDHGKSTLADRFLEITKTVEPRRMKNQYLDQLELERERGVTIKMAPVRMVYKAQTDMDKTRTDADNKMEAQIDTDKTLLYENLTYKIRGAVFSVRKQLGLGHKEIIYQKALRIEFKKIGLNFEQEKNIDVFYDKQKVGVYRPDFIIENKILIELKTLSFIGPQEEKQIWNYLRGTNYELALLVNFGPRKADIYRIINQSRENSPQLSAYILNLIDTPGHSDFSYEVSRALAAVEGAIILVDATQGIQAQTLANFRMARAAGLKIIGAVNKIDLFRTPINANIDADKRGLKTVVGELADLIGCQPSEIYKVSAKTGEGVEELLKAVIEKIPPPAPSQQESALGRALIFDSFYDNHRGIIVSVRVFDGEIKKEDEIYLKATKVFSKIKELGHFSPQLKADEVLKTGAIGYVVAGIKDPEEIKIGDTLFAFKNQEKNLIFSQPGLAGYSQPRPVVFASFYPENSDDYDLLKKAFQKLKLNDSALTFELEQNELLGRGLRIGFLGRFHFEITAERLQKEYFVKIISSFPSVAYRVKTLNGWRIISKAEDLPQNFLEIQEPMVDLEIIAPSIYLNNIFPLERAYRLTDIKIISQKEQIIIRAKMPLRELISDFNDKLKSVTEGFGSFNYILTDCLKADIVRVDFLISKKLIPGLSRFFIKVEAAKEAGKITKLLKKLLPRQQYSQSIQAVINNKVVSREDIPALKKDVAGYLYGGDRSRKMKLWQKQKRGKEKLKEKAAAKIPAEVFKELLRR